MILHYKEIKNLPPLSWFAEVKDGEANIFHGFRVEISDNWYVEGAWSGDFKKGDFLQSEWFCGTGAKVFNDQIVFSTPTHVTSGLFVQNIQGGGYRVSNSLYFLMAKSSLRLDPQYLKYETDFNSITKGIEAYNFHIHLIDGEGKETFVDVYYYRHIVIDDKNQLEIIKKKKTAPFSSFYNYVNRLTRDMALMYQNAQDKDRHYKYGLVTMISKGYDAPCCAVIVKKIGGDTALTFTANGKYAEDSGIEIARKLGYSNIIERDANAYKTRNDMPELEYLSSGELGAEISFSVFEDDYKGNLVFSGERGDSIYDRHSEHRNEDFHVINMQSGLSNSERRLWKGYIPVPMPLYGASAWPSLYAISNSSEMKKYCMNNSYDRPIPRRIIESADIPRGDFGIQKRGAGFSYHYDWMTRIIRRMSPTSATDFALYVRRNKQLHLIQKTVFFIKTSAVYLNRVIRAHLK